MVKKVVYIVGIALLVLLLFLGYWVSRDVVPPLNYVPADSSMVLRLTDLDGLWGQMEQHPCIEQAPVEVRRAVSKRWGLDGLPEWLRPLTRNKVSYLLGKEVVCAFPEGVGDDPMFATRIHPLLKVAEWAARTIHQIEVKWVDGWPVRRVDLGGGQNLHYVLLSRTFLGSMDLDALLACLRTENPLRTDGDYQTLRAKVSASEGLELFLDFARLSSVSSDSLFTPEKGIILIRLGEDGDILLDGKIGLGGKKRHLAKALTPGTLEIFSHVPQDSLLVLASDWSQDLRDTLLFFSKLLEQDNLNPDNLGVWLSLFMVFDIDIKKDLIDAGEEELALVLHDIAVHEVIPIPELALLLKSSDPDSTRDMFYRTVDTLLNNKDCRELLSNYAPRFVVSEEILPFLEIREKDLDGSRIYSMPNVPLGRMFQPALSSLGDFICLTTSELALEKFLSAQATEKNLANHKGYGDLWKRRSNAALFVHVGEWARRIESLDEEAASLGLLRDMDLERFEKEKRPLYEALQYVDGLLLCLSMQDGEIALEGRLHLVGPSGSKTQGAKRKL